MPVKLGVVGGNDERRVTRKSFTQKVCLFYAFADKICGVFGSFEARQIRNIRFFVFGFACDSVIFQTEIAAISVGVQVRFDVFVWQIPADIAVKFTIDGVAGITDFRAPDLLRSFDIARENRDAVGAHYRRMNAVTRARFAI